MLRLLLLVVALALPGLASACASCACGDPTLTAMGTGKPFQGRVRLSVDGRYRWERAESAEGGSWLEDEAEGRLGVAWAVHDRVVLSATLPVVTRGVRAPNLAARRGVSLGDGDVFTRVVALRDRTHTHLGGVLAGLRLPTGVPLKQAGVLVEEGAQPGRGAWAGTAGLWYGLYKQPWSLFASASVQGSSVGFYERAAGVTGLVTVLAQWQPLMALAPQLGVEGRISAPDRVATEVDPTTGGWIWMARPGLAAAPTTDLLITASVQLPFAQGLAGGVREGASPRLGVVVDL